MLRRPNKKEKKSQSSKKNQAQAVKAALRQMHHLHNKIHKSSSRKPPIRRKTKQMTKVRKFNKLKSSSNKARKKKNRLKITCNNKLKIKYNRSLEKMKVKSHIQTPMPKSKISTTNQPNRSLTAQYRSILKMQKNCCLQEIFHPSNQNKEMS